MRKTTWFFYWTCILIAFLSACSPARDEFDRVLTSLPTAVADRTVVRVGEQVEVTLTNTFEMLEQSRVQQRTVKEIEFGACFGSDVVENELIDAQGYCNPKQTDKSPPTWIELGDGTSHMTAIGDIVVQRGQQKTVTHTFSFTRTEPGDVVILPTIIFTPQGEGSVYNPGGTYRRITFE